MMFQCTARTIFAAGSDQRPRWRSFFAAAFLLAGCSSKSSGPTQDPTPAVFTPHYKTASGDILAGKAFFASIEECPKPLLVSALHLFGPNGGLSTQLSSGELSSKVSDIDLSNIAAPDTKASFKAVSVTPFGANVCCTDQRMTGVGDIAAFLAPDTYAGIALPVAKSPPKPGDHVFLIASIIGRTDGPLKHEAVVRRILDGHLMVEYQDSKIELQATSGAPIIDASGRVVAINLAGNHLDTGALFGVGNPVSNWRDALRMSCREY